MTDDEIRTLIAFTKARLDEAYATADILAVQGDLWLVDRSDHAIVRSTFWHVAARCSEEELSMSELRTEHIARYDPGYAKRDITAKRALVKRYELAANAVAAGSALSYVRSSDRSYAEACLDAIQDFAVAWNDHPGYRPSWKPE